VTGRPRLDEVAWTMVSAAAELYRDSPHASYWLRGCLERFSEPLRVAVAGEKGVGKSTLVNALAGDRIAPIEVGDGGGVFAWYRDGQAPAGTVFPVRGQPAEVPVARQDRRLHIDLRQWRAREVERVEVDWPARGLRDLTLIDTPPTGDDGAGVTTARWLATHADAVVHLAREPVEAGLRFLRSAQDAAGGLASPVTTIMALCRADEIGAGRIDALTSAKQIARRRRADPAVRGVCQDVVAVAGLVAQAGRTMREDEFAALRALAALPRPETDALLLSADRFATAEVPVGLPAEARVALLDRFGVFGIRLSTTQAALAGQLVQRSGLSELREGVARFFTDRDALLRARSALTGLAMVLRAEPRPQARRLAADLERAVASTHDFAELRLLAALAAGRVVLPDGAAEEAERLVGGAGTDVADRLGIDYDASDHDLRKVAFDALGRWQAFAESPLFGAEQRAAARTVVRSCEGVLAELALAAAPAGRR
jgi:hypothetical protein